VGPHSSSCCDNAGRPDGSYEPLPVAQAIAYALEGLTALGYLHARGLAYCDFKPDNAIQYDRQLKLIDMGAVIRMDDERSAVFGTVGYQAPEIARQGPSSASDVYTVGRSLAVLALGMSPTTAGAPTPLPAEHPVLDAHESFHRVLLRATDPDPLRRFECAEEMAEQLDGVLREVLATEDGRPRPTQSVRFGPPRGSFAAGLLVDDGTAGGPGPGPGTGGGMGPDMGTDMGTGMSTGMGSDAVGRPGPGAGGAGAAGTAGGPGRPGRRPARHPGHRRPGCRDQGRRVGHRVSPRSCGYDWSAPTWTPATRSRPPPPWTSWPPPTPATGGWTGSAA